ncbi:hypothetical protein B0H67DRAFT_683442 [Lasiosphaeris hirsuta]|uniref:Uncharacterized protein n=1 Tax=Lasiosphaeris hirsuta TaxID=260670 RepID=A0AA40AG05_9PEZI|nr:hypothetical protein B0H67DRAFT_683442 [Lasiosphaeris hirsuta]
MAGQTAATSSHGATHTAITINTVPPASLSRGGRPGLPRRQSRFTEEMTGEYSPAHTPAHSMYEHDTAASYRTAESYHASRGPSINSGSGNNSRTLVFRGMNSCLHGAACVILMAIMVDFLSRLDGYWLGHMSGLAVALLAMLGLDTLLDITSLIRLQKQWPSWTLLLRLIYGIGYIILFMIYVAHGQVFPSGFTFWGMASGFAGPVVYLFLWLLGVWNLLHTTLRRHHLGNSVRSYVTSIAPTSPSRPRSGSQRLESKPARTWRTMLTRRPHAQHDVESLNTSHHQGNLSRATTARSEPTISLRDQPTKAEAKRESFAATTRTTSDTGSPHKSDERGLSRREREEELDLGGLSPPPPIAAVVKL